LLRKAKLSIIYKQKLAMLPLPVIII